MGQCEGKWLSYIKWEQGGDAGSDEFNPDGDLSITSHTSGDFKGTHADAGNVSYEVQGVCAAAGVHRFSIEYTRDAGTGVTYSYKGSVRLLDESGGPGFIYGTVTAAAGEGAPEGSSNKNGSWEAVRAKAAGGAGGGSGSEPGDVGSNTGTQPGGGEPGNTGSSTGTSPGGGETEGGEVVEEEHDGEG